MYVETVAEKQGDCTCVQGLKGLRASKQIGVSESSRVNMNKDQEIKLDPLIDEKSVNSRSRIQFKRTHIKQDGQ